MSQGSGETGDSLKEPQQGVTGSLGLCPHPNTLLIPSVVLPGDFILVQCEDHLQNALQQVHWDTQGGPVSTVLASPPWFLV